MESWPQSWVLQEVILLFIPGTMTTDDLARGQCAHDEYATEVVWNAQRFISRLGNLDCFRDGEKVI